MKISLLCFGVLAAVLMGTSCTKKTNPPPPPKDSTTHPTDTPTLRTGLLLYLPFNGNMADSSGNGNTTSAVGGAVLTYDEHGYANSALAGTGNGERLIVTNNGSIKFDTALSVSFDVMVKTFLLQDLVTMVQNSNGTGLSFGIGLGIGTTNRMDFGVSNAGTDCGVIMSPSNSVVDSSQYVLQPERWYNVICLFRKGTMQIFINGQLVSTKAATTSSISLCSSAQVIIGGWWQGGGATFNGVLDEVRMYNRTLTAKEIAYLSRNFQVGSTGDRPALRTRQL